MQIRVFFKRNKIFFFFPFFGYCRIGGEEKDDLQRDGDSGGTVVVFG